MCPEVLEPQSKPRTPPTLVSVDGRTYPLRSAHLRARAEAGLAHTTLVQEFENPHDEPLEVIYTMPLPADGAVLGYVIRMGDRVIRGEIEKREVAEEAYKKALYEGRTAGLLEENRADTFMQRLGNLPARTGATIEISVLHPMAFVVGEGATATTATAATAAAPSWEYRFPTVVSTRYQGAPGRVPDAGALDADRGRAGDIPTRIALDLRTTDASAAAVTSPSHPITALQAADAVHIHLADGAPLDRDLVLRWPAATPAVGVTVTEGPGLPGDTGRYALLTVTPPAVPGASFRRDVTILIDASGSMDGPPLESAKLVAATLLRSLAPGDRFEVMAFANTTVSLTRGLEDASEKSIASCLGKIGSLQAGGGTEMENAFEAALQNLRPDSQRQIVLLTDGYIGFEREVMDRIRTGRVEGVRVHAVGIGSAPNRALTQGVSRAGRGVEVLVGDGSEAGAAAARLLAATARPVLTELTIGGDAVVGFAPARPRDVFAGQPVVVAVEIRAEGGTLDVSGRLAGSKDVWGWRAVVGALEAGVATGVAPGGAGPAPDDALPIGALYGREKIADVEVGVETVSPRAAALKEALKGITILGDSLGERIENIALRHRIVSRRTSLVAIAETPSVDPLAPRRRARLAVEVPHGVSAEGVGLLGETSGFALGIMPMALGVGDSERLFDTATFLRSQPPAAAMRRPWKDRKPSAPEVTVSIQATVVEWDEEGLVLEIEAPEDSFELPDGRITLKVDDRPMGEFSVDRARSTAGGPHAKGVLVRLAVRGLRLTPDMTGLRVQVYWYDLGKTGSRPIRYDLVFAAAPPPTSRGTA